jgi:hypothetical protein
MNTLIITKQERKRRTVNACIFTTPQTSELQTYLYLISKQGKTHLVLLHQIYIYIYMFLWLFKHNVILPVVFVDILSTVVESPKKGDNPKCSIMLGNFRTVMELLKTPETFPTLNEYFNYYKTRKEASNCQCMHIYNTSNFHSGVFFLVCNRQDKRFLSLLLLTIRKIPILFCNWHFGSFLSCL